MKNIQVLKKFLLLIFAVLSLLLFNLNPVQATTQTCNPNEGLNVIIGCDNPFIRGGALDINSIFNTILVVLIYVSIGIFLILGIFAGIQFARAGDSSEARKKALEKFLTPLGAVLLIGLLFGLVYLLVNWAGLSGRSSLSSSPCTGRTAYGIAFTGFLAPNTTQVCAVTNAQGDILRIGCVSSSKTYNGPGRNATPQRPEKVDLGALTDDVCR